MQFKLKGTVERKVYSDSEKGTFIYSVSEKYMDKDQNHKSKNWTICTKQELSQGSEYELEGYVSESKDKKKTYSDGKDVYRINFNAVGIKATEEMYF